MKTMKWQQHQFSDIAAIVAEASGVPMDEIVSMTMERSIDGPTMFHIERTRVSIAPTAELLLAIQRARKET